MKNIKAVFLDMDNTLIDFDASAKECMKRALLDRGVAFREEMYEVFTRINPILWRKIEQKELTVDGLHQVRWNMIFAEIGLSIDGVAFEGDFRAYLKESGIPIEGAVDLFTYLKEKGYILCVASNGPYEQQKSRMRAAGMYEGISHWFVSERMGANKPAKEFFDAAMRELSGILPSECVMIGDSLTADIEGSLAYGMHAVWYDRKGENTPVNADAVVHTLSEIKEIL